MRLYALLFTIFTMTIFFPFTARAADTFSLLASGGKGGWVNVTRPLTVDDMTGRVVLLDFWTYGCINCMQVIPDLEYLEEKFGDKLLIIGVHSAKFAGESGNKRIAAAAQRFGLKHPVINDSDYGIWRAMDVHAWPSLVLLGPEGKEISRYSGEGHRADLEKDIARAVKTLDMPVSLSTVIAPEAAATTLTFPARLAAGDDNTLWIADSGHNRIIAVDRLSNKITQTIGAGTEGHTDGDFAEAQFNHPRGLTLVGDLIYVADTENNALREIDLKKQTVRTLAGTGARGYPLYPGKYPEAKTRALASPWDVELLPDGRTLAIAMAGTHQIWGYHTPNGTLSLLIGDGFEALDDAPTPAQKAALAQPSGLSLAPDGTLFFVDAESSALRAQRADGIVYTLIGTGLFDFGHIDGHYPTAQLQHPQGLFAQDGQVIVADTYNNALRLYDRTSKALSTLTLTGGTLNEPGDVLVIDGTAYVADTDDHAIKTVDLSTGAVKTLAIEKE